jgi:hypothetical protein
MDPNGNSKMESSQETSQISTNSPTKNNKNTSPRNNKPRKISKFVGIDPRAVGYVIGKSKINIKEIAVDTLHNTGKSVFIQWIPPDIYWGSFKITSESQDAIHFAKDKIKTLEKEFVHKVEDGIFNYPKINKQLT